MEEIDIKLALARLAQATAHAIINNDPEACVAFSKTMHMEIDEEIARTRKIAELRKPSTVKELQEKSGMGLFSCKNALEKSEWDINRAMDILRG